MGPFLGAIEVMDVQLEGVAKIVLVDGSHGRILCLAPPPPERPVRMNDEVAREQTSLSSATRHEYANDRMEKVRSSDMTVVPV
jgi:hypothetical protein